MKKHDNVGDLYFDLIKSNNYHLIYDLKFFVEINEWLIEHSMDLIYSQDQIKSCYKEMMNKYLKTDVDNYNEFLDDFMYEWTKTKFLKK